MTAKKIKSNANPLMKNSAGTSSGIQLGYVVQDAITGFIGIATSRTEHLYGCIHIGITSRKLDKEGVPLGSLVVDEQRVIVIEKRKPQISPDSNATTGGPTSGTTSSGGLTPQSHSLGVSQRGHLRRNSGFVSARMDVLSI